MARTPHRRARVVVLDPIAEGAVRELGRHFDVEVHLRPSARELPTLIRGAQAVVVRSGVLLTGDAIRAAPGLRLIARAGTGVDNIDVEAARQAGIVVCTVPGASAQSVAELAFALMLALSRRIVVADRQLRAGVRAKESLLGTELAGRTLAVIGLGAVGGRVAGIGRAMDMEVVGVVRDPVARRPAPGGADVPLVGLRAALRCADVVCVAVPLTAGTTHLIGRTELRLMKPSALLVNVARGEVVDEAALVEALRTGRVAGAGLDVGGHERTNTALVGMDNVVLTPHIGATTAEAQARVGRALVESVRAALAGEPVPHRIC
ncbi:MULTISPECIES: hydroxyacid dehydrogenase [unclassified Streptomyces]|uniref:hydroxyacid dehydrogenase n=1 Tax=unclassified Streptomyces TaxID=2593676 RepID=UPI0004C20420|nr:MULTISPECIES: hydroxyacid dehydrogenase [unclassified Streptomyces]